MTFTIPTWLLWLIGVPLGLAILAALFVVAAFAFVGWTVTKAWRPPNW